MAYTHVINRTVTPNTIHELIDGGYAYTDPETNIDGHIRVINGKCVFDSDKVIDLSDEIILESYKSMVGKFEASEVGTLPSVDCNINLINDPDPLKYVDPNDSTKYIVEIVILNNLYDFPLEFSYGSLMTTGEHPLPNTWEVRTKGVNGSYAIEVPNSGNLENIFIRWQGCTEYIFTTWTTDGVTTPPSGVTTDAFISTGVEISNDIITWENVPSDITVPTGLIFNAGYALPLWRNEPTGTGGKLQALNKCFTHHENLASQSPSKFSPNNTAAFQQLYFQGFKAAQNLKAYNDANGQPYGNLDLVISSGGYNWSGVNDAGLVEMGKQCFYIHSHCQNYDTGDWNSISQETGIHTFDEEAEGTLYVGNIHHVFDKILQGFKSVAPNAQILWYGKPVSWFPFNNLNATDSEITSYLNSTTDDNYNQTNMKTLGCLIDVRSVYDKVPYPARLRKYKHNLDGSFVLSGGKRVFDNTQDYSQEIFGTTVWFYKQPNVSSIEPDGKCDFEHYVYMTHRYYSVLLMSLMKLRKCEFGNFQMHNPTVNNKLRGIMYDCLRTEPFTNGGNSIVKQEKGAEAIKCSIFFGLLSGAVGTAFWDDAFFFSRDNNAPYRGEPIDPASYPETIKRTNNFSRFRVAADCIRTFITLLNGASPTSYTYIHFYMPCKSYRESEIACVGIYTGSRFVFFTQYPDAENAPNPEDNEVTNFVIKINGTSYNYALSGSDPRIDVITGLSNGINPSDFKIEYTNIYGVAKRIIGVVTDNPNSRYY